MDEKGGDAANMGDAVPEQAETDASGHDVQKAEQPETDTSGHDVQKAEQPEPDTLGHDVQRPGRAADMPKPYPVENARHNCAVENGNPQGLKLVAGTADKPANRTSLKEKMEANRAQVADTGKPGIEKARRREETL